MIRKLYSIGKEKTALFVDMEKRKCKILNINILP